MNVIILPIPYSDVRLHFKQGCIWRWHESRHEDMKLEETQRTFTHFDTLRVLAIWGQICELQNTLLPHKIVMKIA